MTQFQVKEKNIVSLKTYMNIKIYETKETLKKPQMTFTMINLEINIENTKES